MSDASPAKGAEIVSRLARHIADERDVPWSHPGTRYRLETEATEMIDEWRRHPKPEPQTDIDLLCAEAIENDRAMAEAKAERAAVRSRIFESQHPQPVIDPDWTVIAVKCARTGHIWEIRVPPDQTKLLLRHQSADDRDFNMIRV
jgi:hypothetical protein